MENKSTEYVLGFLFNPEMDSVVLIEKKKPKWQEGLLNGVGGKIESNEPPEAAMTREFKEETGVTIEGWKPICIMKGNDWRVFVFYYVAELGVIDAVETMEEEEVTIFLLDELSDHDKISNLQWLIPLCIDKELFENSNYNVTVNF